MESWEGTYIGLILLKAIFIEELHNAIIAKDKDKVIKIMKQKISEVELAYITVTDFDIDELNAWHVENLKGNLDWAVY